ncbi:potassium-transporting ATPase subunit C [Streptomyces sp. BRA346]|uniref:potassium-transporting ATPase subunit C n=1 Tax=Streptomyces sp. BRA346 TaxID=2878199 RepID=UPI004062A6EB
MSSLTASGSGVDPDISPAYATLQVTRVARANGLPRAEAARPVEDHTAGRALGFLGEPRVNVLELNLALHQLEK